MSVYLRLLNYVKPYWTLFLFSIFGFFLYSGTQPALAWVAGWLAEAVFKPDTMTKYLIPTTLIGIYLVRGIGSFIGTYFLVKVSESIVHTLRCELFEHQLNLPKSFYDKTNSGELISLVIYNVTQVTGAATTAITVMIREGIAVIALFSTLFYLNWKLSLIFLAVSPIIGIVVSIASKHFRRLSKKIQGAMGDISHITSEATQGYQVVKSYAGEAYEQQRFRLASKDSWRQNIKFIRVSAINTPILQMIVALALAGLLFIGLSFVGEMDPASFVTYMTAAGLLPKPIRQLSEVNRTIQKGIAAAESIFDLIDTQAENNTGEYQSKRVAGKIEFKNLSFAYPIKDEIDSIIDNPAKIQKTVLENISLTIESGQSVAIVGRSGSGKSTLTQLIPRFYDDFRGQILLDGHSINDFELANLRSQIAIVAQQTTLFNDTIANNIAYGSLASASLDEIKQAAKSAFALGFIEQLSEGFDTQVGENGTLLSGGQKQRIAIARAILKDAPILILDEATSALDTESEREIQAALEHVMQGRTTIVIAHRLSTIKNSDKIVVLDEGKIVEQGGHEDLLAKQGIYAHLYEKLKK